MKNRYQVIRRPIITEKGLSKKEAERTLCFEVDQHANKVEIKRAVEQIFKVKVESVRTSLFQGKERRRGVSSGYKPDWKKAYVKLQQGEKMPEYGENV